MPKTKKHQEKNELVFADRNFIYCDSQMVADKFCTKHQNVVRVIERIKSKSEQLETLNLSASMSEFAPVFIRYDDVYHGKKFTAYRMNKTAFTLVAMRFETDAAFVWQTKFAAAFATMERTIAKIANQRANQEYIEARHAGKLIRRVETDTIQRFVEYATAQGSQNAKMYYTNISKMQNTALFFYDQKFKNVRELLDINQLSTVKIADNIVSRALKEGMETGLNYRDIFKMAKNRIETFATLNGKSSIPEYDQRLTIAR